MKNKCVLVFQKTCLCSTYAYTSFLFSFIPLLRLLVGWLAKHSRVFSERDPNWVLHRTICIGWEKPVKLFYFFISLHMSLWKERLVFSLAFLYINSINSKNYNYCPYFSFEILTNYGESWILFNKSKYK